MSLARKKFPAQKLREAHYLLPINGNAEEHIRSSLKAKPNLQTFQSKKWAKASARKFEAESS
jgi:hypothetical protein